MASELEQRVATLERELLALKELVVNGHGTRDWQSTIGMFANDPEFEESLRLGREYREEERRRELEQL